MTGDGINQARMSDAERAGFNRIAWHDEVNRCGRWCHRCQTFEPVAAFGRDSSRWDGLTTSYRRSLRRRRRRS